MKNSTIEMSSYMGKNMVNLMVETESEIDRIACKVLKNDCPPFLASFSEVEINGKTILRHDVGKLVGLSYFSTKLTRLEFLRLWNELITPLVECGDWFLRYDAFCFEPQYVFVDRHTLNISYIYLPLSSASAGNDEIKAMFTGLMERCELTDGQQLQIELYKFFARSEFSISELKEIIDRNRLGDGTAARQTVPVTAQRIPTPTPPAPAPVRVETSAQVRTPAPVTPPSTAQQPPTAGDAKSRPLTAEEEFEQELLNSLNGVKGVKDKKKEKPAKEHKPLFGGFGKKEPKPAKEKQDKRPNHAIADAVGELIPPTASKEVISGAALHYSSVPARSHNAQSVVPCAGDDATEMFDNDAYGAGAFLRLVNPASGNNLPLRFDLDFASGAVSIGRFDAGKGVRQSDIEFAPTVKSVSRSQARIEKHGVQFLLIDLGSANGTYLNGVRLAPSTPVPLNSGDCVGFSDKGVDYIFNA